jgi:hypothetical protein
LLLLVAALLPGCGGIADVPAPSPETHTAIAVDAFKQTPPAVPATWPLTGLPGEVVERTALAVKVENPSDARPQSGLEAADVVWEEMVEGGISRFVAVYHSQLPDAVGPVRSVRPMDGAIAGPTGGILACSGGQSRFIEKTRDAGLQVIVEGGSGYFRSTDRRSPHNLYVRPAEIIARADSSHKGSPLPEFVFAANAATATAAVAGSPITKLNVTISSVAKPDWTWDAATGKFLRAEKGTPSLSASGVRLSADNVIVLAVEVRSAGGTDAAGSSIPETILVGSGAAVVATGGKVVEAEWSKSAVDQPVVLKTKDGKAIELAPGQTWIELAPKSNGGWSTS